MVHPCYTSPHGIEARQRSQVGPAGRCPASDARAAAQCISCALSAHDGTVCGGSENQGFSGEPADVRTKGLGQSALLLLDAVDVLARERINYAVIGAMAASIHGVVRASVDADAVLSLVSTRASDVERLFIGVGFETELRMGDPDDPIAALLQLTDSFGNRVDLLIGLRGLEAEAFSRAMDVPFQGASLRVIGREDFIAMKVFAGGPQDLADARNALSIAGDSLDVVLLERLAKRYGHDAVENLKKLQNA